MTDDNIASLECLKLWLTQRPPLPDDEEKVVINAPDSLRSIGFPDLIIEKAGPEHQETIVCSHDFGTQKLKVWTELNHLVTWSLEFLNVLRMNRSSLATLELLRGAHEFTITMSKFHVDECVDVVSAATSFDVALDIQHPDTRGQNYAANNILVDDSLRVQDIVRQVFASLYSKCVVRLVVKTACFYSAALATYLVDLMHSSGAMSDEVKCVGFDKRDSLGSERFTKPITPTKHCKLSVIAMVFKQTDTFAAAQGIIDSYFREMYPNLIILVEESAYVRFVQDWQRYYSNVMQIGPRLDEKTTVVDSFNEKIQIDLAAIDIKASHKMSGYAINVLKFRSPQDLLTLMSNLRKVPYMTLWNDDVLSSREFCLRLNQCDEYWINHVPRRLAGRRFTEDIQKYYHDVVADDMTDIYNSVYAEYSDEVDLLRKLHANFLKKDQQLRIRLLMHTYITVITKSKSLRNGSTVSEAVARLRRFHRGAVTRLTSYTSGNSRIETITRPVGLAIVLMREDSCLKNRAILLELIFKNLLIGNAVLLACPVNTLGAKFSIEYEHVIPFKIVHESMPDISRLSLDTSIAVSESCPTKKQCPKNTYVIEITPETSSEMYETMTVALGLRRRSIWFSDIDQIDYWSDE